MERLCLDSNIFLSMWFDEVGAGLPVPFGYYSERLFDLGWKDCIHILTAQKNDATLVTWDKGMQEACRILGVKVTDPQALNL